MLQNILDTLIASVSGDLQDELISFRSSILEGGVTPEDAMFAGYVAARLSGTELEQLANDMFAKVAGV